MSPIEKTQRAASPHRKKIRKLMKKKIIGTQTILKV